MVLDCAADGRRERQFPKSGGRLATLGYLIPGLRRMLMPVMKAKGKREKERVRGMLKDG